MNIRSEFITDLATMSEPDLAKQIVTLREMQREDDPDPLWQELYQRQIDCVVAIAILRFPRFVVPIEKAPEHVGN